MDFSDRKYCEDGLGNKKRSGFYLKMCVQLILNLSVFSLFCVFLKEEAVLQVTSVSGPVTCNNKTNFPSLLSEFKLATTATGNINTAILCHINSFILMFLEQN